MKLLTILCIFLPAVLHAQDGRSAFEQSLELDTSVKSEESWVQIQGVRYRKVEFSGGHYYIKFIVGNFKQADLFCEPPPGAQKEQLVGAESQVLRRARAFVKVFNESCSSHRGNLKVTVQLNPAIGLSSPEVDESVKRK